MQGVKSFTDEEVRAIRSNTRPARELAEYYGCGSETIRRIKRRETYFNVPDAPEITPEMIQESLDKMMAKLAEKEDEKPKGPRHPGCTGEGCEMCEKLDLFVGKEENVG